MLWVRIPFFLTFFLSWDSNPRLLDLVKCALELKGFTKRHLTYFYFHLRFFQGMKVFSVLRMMMARLHFGYYSSTS